VEREGGRFRAEVLVGEAVGGFENR